MQKKAMKKTKLIALSGIIAAASVVVMLVAYFPSLTYAMPAISGCLLVFLVFEAGKKHAFLVYLVVAALSFFICEKEAALSYILFFGYYPILKAILEGIPSRVLEWIAKFSIFNIAFAGVFWLGTTVFGLDTSEMGAFGKYTIAVFFVSANIMFLAYDICLSKLIVLYLRRYREKIRKYIG